MAVKHCAHLWAFFIHGAMNLPLTEDTVPPRKNRPIDIDDQEIRCANISFAEGRWRHEKALSG
jgi:hypothetical protein